MSYFSQLQMLKSGAAFGRTPLYRYKTIGLPWHNNDIQRSDNTWIVFGACLSRLTWPAFHKPLLILTLLIDLSIRRSFYKDFELKIHIERVLKMTLMLSAWSKVKSTDSGQIWSHLIWEFSSPNNNNSSVMFHVPHAHWSPVDKYQLALNSLFCNKTSLSEVIQPFVSYCSHTPSEQQCEVTLRRWLLLSLGCKCLSEACHIWEVCAFVYLRGC